MISLPFPHTRVALLWVEACTAFVPLLRRETVLDILFTSHWRLFMSFEWKSILPKQLNSVSHLIFKNLSNAKFYDSFVLILNQIWYELFVDQNFESPKIQRNFCRRLKLDFDFQYQHQNFVNIDINVGFWKILKLILILRYGKFLKYNIDIGV